ncbi:MAG TPA: hypothetical protein VH143_06550 [Kofleriaceae bacterium]|nr:hypothetical protein [Kofleriaceae bacterium]
MVLAVIGGCHKSHEWSLAPIEAKMFTMAEPSSDIQLRVEMTLPAGYVREESSPILAWWVAPTSHQAGGSPEIDVDLSSERGSSSNLCEFEHQVTMQHERRAGFEYYLCGSRAADGRVTPQSLNAYVDVPPGDPATDRLSCSVPRLFDGATEADIHDAIAICESIHVHVYVPEGSAR